MTTIMILAFDIGTTGNKATLVDAATGTIVDSIIAPYPTRYTPDGGAEQSPDDWWASVGAACRELHAHHPELLKHVQAIGCSGMMNGVVLVDRKGQALRGAILHADVRSAPQNRALEHSLGRDALFAATANRPDCHLTLPKMLWLRAHEPKSLNAAAFVVQAKDYVVGRLTGVVGVSDPSDASLTGAFDVARRVWASDLWQAAGLDPRLLPAIVPSAQIVGKVTKEAASATGLTAGTPVVMGGGDGACATAGSGVAPGEAYNYLGGTSWIGLSADAPLYDPRLSNYCGLDQRVTVFGTVQAAGSSLEWFAGAIGEANPAALDIPALDVPPGARNLFFLPYLQGERAPLWDSDARGAPFWTCLPTTAMPCPPCACSAAARKASCGAAFSPTSTIAPCGRSPMFPPPRLWARQWRRAWAWACSVRGTMPGDWFASPVKTTPIPLLSPLTRHAPPSSTPSTRPCKTASRPWRNWKTMTLLNAWLQMISIWQNS